MQVITSSVFKNNHARDRANSIFYQGCSLEIRNCNFTSYDYDNNNSVTENFQSGRVLAEGTQQPSDEAWANYRVVVTAWTTTIGPALQADISAEQYQEYKKLVLGSAAQSFIGVGSGRVQKVLDGGAYLRSQHFYRLKSTYVYSE